MTSYRVMHLLPRIAVQSIHDGTETNFLIAAVAYPIQQIQQRLPAFLGRTANQVRAGP